MIDNHSNIEVLKQFDPTDVSNTLDVFAEDVIFHYYNPHFPDLHGDYIGREGVQSFFDKLRMTTGDSFKPNVVSVKAFGDELVVVHRKQVINMGGHQLETDVIVVWRIVDGKIMEVWDIPSIHNAHVLKE